MRLTSKQIYGKIKPEYQKLYNGELVLTGDLKTKETNLFYKKPGKWNEVADELPKPKNGFYLVTLVTIGVDRKPKDPHSTVIVIDDTDLFYYDPAGFEPINELKKWIESSKRKVHVNKVKNQKMNEECCGLLSAEFVNKIFTMDFNKLVNDYLPKWKRAKIGNSSFQIPSIGF